MDPALIARVVTLRASLRRRDLWTPCQLATHQQLAVGQLRAYAYARSAFYRSHHAGMQSAPLSDLPPVTKADLMEHFDQAVTDPRLSLAAVEARLTTLVETDGDPGMPWRGRWWMAATAGTTGRRGVFVWNRREWATMLASYARANDWAGVAVGPGHPVRVAVVSSRMATHQSAAVGATLRSRMTPTLRLDAAAPIADTVDSLNAFKPRLLVGYASALRPLAGEQRAGRLRIAPEAVMSASEVLADRAATEMASAWGTRPFNVYAATETAGIASPCLFHRSHVYEDLVFAEPVDQHGDPCPPGTAGARLLVSVLFSRTLPLIRYELTDRVVLDGRGCECGRPFGLLQEVEGRTEDVLHLPGRSGAVRVHPNVFHDVLDQVVVEAWQVVQEPSHLRVILVGSRTLAVAHQVETDLRRALDALGVVGISISVEFVPDVPRTPLGKAPLVRALAVDT